MNLNGAEQAKTRTVGDLLSEARSALARDAIEAAQSAAEIATAAAERIAAALALHQPLTAAAPFGRTRQVCVTCGGCPPYPCPTVLALTGADRTPLPAPSGAGTTPVQEDPKS